MPRKKIVAGVVAGGPPPKTIRVIRTGSVCRVVPPAEAGIKANADSFRWLNSTGAQITLFLPPGAIAAGAVAQTVPAGLDFITGIDGATPGTYPYQVFCQVTGNYAIGTSEPIIIIE